MRLVVFSVVLYKLSESGQSAKYKSRAENWYRWIFGWDLFSKGLLDYTVFEIKVCHVLCEIGSLEFS